MTVTNWRIHKYLINTTDVQRVAMPAGAKILHTRMQNGAITLWAIGDTLAEDVARRIRVFGTGNPLPSNVDGFTYIGTVFDGPSVWHVFEG